jgi:hypothetical protein
MLHWRPWMSETVYSVFVIGQSFGKPSRRTHLDIGDVKVEGNEQAC